MSDSAQPAFASLPGMESLIGELYRLSGGEKFGLTQPQFLVIVRDIGRKYLHGATGNSEVRALYLSLRVEELALARACAAGNEHAWETFLIRYREKLYEMALHIAREDSAARDLADSLYADLYGTSTREGQRISKLASYTGRGSLEGWLRTVLAQEYVNRYRRRKRLVSLDEEIEEGSQFAATDPVTETVVDPRLENSIDEALLALPAEDRFILASYYLDELTLAMTAQTLGVHESTISRKLDKLAKSLRKQILAGMARRGMSRRQAQEALETDIRDLRIDIRKHLSQDSDRRTFPEEKAKARATDGSS